MIAGVDAVRLVIAMGVGGAWGFYCGGKPYRAANERNRPGLAVAALIFCSLIGLLGGCLVSLPVAYVLKWIIMAMGAGESQDNFGSNYPSEREKRIPISQLPYTILGTAVVCNRCGRAGSKVDGGPPLTCPNCKLSFSMKAEAAADETPKPWKRMKTAKRAPQEERDDDLVPLERI